MLGFRERTGGCGAGRSLRLALQHKLLLLAWRFEPTPMEVHSSPAKQPASEALTASQDMWELAGEQQQSRSRGPGNNLRPAWGCLAACVLSTLLLPALQPSAFIAPLLSHTGLVLPGLGRWYQWPHAHISTMTPPLDPWDSSGRNHVGGSGMW